MKTIRITRHGVFRSGTDMVPIGTLIDVPDDFTGWANKWVRVDSPKATLEAASPAPAGEPGPEEWPEMDEELQAARNEYRRVFGEKPHARMKAETIRRKLEEEQDDE